MAIHQSSGVPWQSHSSLRVEVDGSCEFSLRIRIPRWAEGFTLSVNGEPVTHPEVIRGYARISQVWSSGDRVDMEFTMPIRRIYAHPKVESCRDRVAMIRGPLVYCLEQSDNGDLSEVSLPIDSKMNAEYRSDLLGGVVVVVGEGRVRSYDLLSNLYQQDPYPFRRGTVIGIPYFLWDNRESGAMQVWIHEE